MLNHIESSSEVTQCSGQQPQEADNMINSTENEMNEIQEEISDSNHQQQQNSINNNNTIVIHHDSDHHILEDTLDHETNHETVITECDNSGNTFIAFSVKISFNL